MKQMTLSKEDFKKVRKGYGGELLKKAAARQSARPLATKSPMHLVLRSSKAKGRHSFQNPKNARKVAEITRKFAKKYGVKLRHAANVGNHLHLMIQLGNRYSYAPFIRGLTGAIAMAVTDTNKWRSHGRERIMDDLSVGNSKKLKFWDYRPFTRVIEGGRSEYLKVSDYILINRLEGRGVARPRAEILVRGSPLST